ncbi:MAG: dynamin family protein [Neisseria zoodegmatis]|uniref:dynamin family protein n=1 Tax=Neisseria zoodegmatis TaxID=326523 RepID=UPI0026F0506E|nr:dynamin family protein [Neisseria zoodegmatis]MDO5070260.1 dynamin family protein [Neisseria zoodegmatis]
MSNKNKQFSVREMMGYRDQLVKSLNDELELLAEMQKLGVFDKETGLIHKNNYDEKITLIKEEREKLNHFDVVLAVVGTMKAGKSTTINAIVGREIMPNRNRPMTALPTSIYHTPGQLEPQLSFNNPAVEQFIQDLGLYLKENSSWEQLKQLETDEMQELTKFLLSTPSSKFKFKQKYCGEQEIFKFLAGLNDLVRLSEILRQEEVKQKSEYAEKLPLFPYDQCRNLDQLPKIEIEFRHLTDIKANEGRLILLDTPGPNEAGQEHLRPMLTEQLQRSSAVLLVLDYTQLKSEASESVKQQLQDIPTISEERLFALVNKFDAQDSNSDNEKTVRDIIFNDFLSGRIKHQHIYPLSSKTAFLANRMAAELEKKGKPAWQEDCWVHDFIKIAYGTRMKQAKWEKEEIADIQEAIIELIEDSRVQLPLQEAIAQTQSEAPKIAMQSALARLNNVLHEVYNTCDVWNNTMNHKTEEEIKQLKQKLNNLTEDLKQLNEIKNQIKGILSEMIEKEKGKIENNQKQLKDSINSEFQELVKGIKKDQKESLKKRIWISLTGITPQNKDLDENNNEKIYFNSMEEAKAYINNKYSTCNQAIRKVCETITNDFKESENNLKDQLKLIDEQVRNVFQKVKKVYGDGGYSLKLGSPNIIANLNILKEDFSFNYIPGTSYKTVNQLGLWAWLLRKTGMGGQ